MGEGHYAWDLKKGSMVINGPVGKAVASKNGQELDVTYSYGTRQIVVPKNVPIVQIAPGDRAMVKPGVSVFLLAQSSAGGLTTRPSPPAERARHRRCRTA